MTRAFVKPWYLCECGPSCWPPCVRDVPVGQSAAKHQFVLEATRPAQPVRQPHDVVLAVRGFTIDPLYDGRGLKYRKGESEYEADFYNEFVIAPQVLLSSQTRNWLSRSGMFQTVLETGSLVEATHILEGNVLVLYGDFRDRKLPQAVMQIRIFLIANKGSPAGDRLHSGLSGFAGSPSTDRRRPCGGF